MKMMKNLLLILILLFVSTLLRSQHLDQQKLIEDARQLKFLVEACHPDPYMNTNGKIGFNLLFQEMVAKIPDDGMEEEDFWWLLSGFLANIEDGHTYLMALQQPDSSVPGGIPLRFAVLADTSIVIVRSSLSGYMKYIGWRVKRINGVEMNFLLERVSSLYPMENIFDQFRNLEVYLWYADYMKRLFPGWTSGDDVTVEVTDSKNNDEKLIIPTGEKVSYKTSGLSESQLSLPETKRCDFAFEWLDRKRDVGYLRIDKQDEFREYAEEIIAGLSSINDPATLKGYRNQYTIYAHQWYNRYHGEPGPDSLELLVDGLPSFSGFMRDVTGSLKREGTSNLVIDLRNNRGGVSLLSDILIYFLFGKEKMAEIDRDNWEVSYLSEISTSIVPSFNTEVLNRQRSGEGSLSLEPGDYDFYSMNRWKEGNGAKPGVVPESKFAATRTFLNEYRSGEYSGFYTPANIYVLAGSTTFSAGYETLVRLIKCGAEFAGVPPAQSGNCFGMAIYPVDGLAHSKIKLNVSVRKIVLFPGDQERGHQLNPDIPLDYQLFRKYNYDPNATVLMVLDRIRGKK